jgi:hypothetical protein
LKPGKQTFVYFGGVNCSCDDYLNGELLGRHEGGFTPFQFEVTGRIRTGVQQTDPPGKQFAHTGWNTGIGFRLVNLWPWILIDFRSPFECPIAEKWNGAGLSEKGERNKASYVMKDFCDRGKGKLVAPLYYRVI